EREILPRRVQLRGAWCSEQRKRSEIGEAIVWVGAKVRYSHPERIASAPRGVGEMSQIERAIVEDAVIAASELHEAFDCAVVDDQRIAGNSAVRQCTDEAVIGQGRAAGRTQKNTGGL